MNEFNCMVCGKRNCLLCKAIHTPQTCKEYQEDLRIKAANDKAAQETQKMIEVSIYNRVCACVRACVCVHVHASCMCLCMCRVCVHV